MQSKLKTTGKYAGYIILTFLLTFYFMLLSFPYTILQDRFLPQLEKRLSCDINLKEIEMTPLLWLAVSGIEVLQKNQKERTLLLEIDELRVRPSLFSLFLGKIALRIKGDLYKGWIKGKISKAKEDLDINLFWKDLRPGDYPLLSRIQNAEFDAVLNGELRFHMPNNNWLSGNGTLSLDLIEGTAKNIQVYGFTLPVLQKINGGGKLSMEKRKTTLETLSLESDQFSVSLNGNVDLSPRFDSSRMNLKGKVKLTGELGSDYEPLLSGFLSNKDPDGSYAFSLKGTVTKPRFSF